MASPLNVLHQVAMSSSASVAGSEMSSNMTRAVTAATNIVDQQEVQNLSQIIKAWRELNKEVSTLSEQIREKKKRMKTMDEMILRIMKKNNIGALDLKESGGRILYKRASSKAGLTPKNLMALLSTHLKSEVAAADALKYINEHRETNVRESILYEQ
jgi:hypothetical protein